MYKKCGECVKGLDKGGVTITVAVTVTATVTVSRHLRKSKTGCLTSILHPSYIHLTSVLTASYICLACALDLLRRGVLQQLCYPWSRRAKRHRGPGRSQAGPGPKAGSGPFPCATSASAAFWDWHVQGVMRLFLPRSAVQISELVRRGALEAFEPTLMGRKLEEEVGQVLRAWFGVGDRGCRGAIVACSTGPSCVSFALGDALQFMLPFAPTRWYSILWLCFAMHSTPVQATPLNSADWQCCARAEAAFQICQTGMASNVEHVDVAGYSTRLVRGMLHSDRIHSAQLSILWIVCQGNFCGLMCMYRGLQMHFLCDFRLR